MMTQEQRDRWQDFALRMARSCYTNRNRPKRDEIVAWIEDFFERLEDWQLIVNWEHGDAYPEGHRRYQKWGVNFARRMLVTDEIKEMTANCGVLTLREQRAYGHAEDRKDYDRADAITQDAEDRAFAPMICCIRAGLDVAVDAETGGIGGVLGYTVGDLRRMYPEGIPEWILSQYTKPIDATVPDEATVWL